MSLAERRKRAEEEREKLIEMKVERAKAKANDVISSDQFRMSAIATPEARICIDSLLNETFRNVINPENEFLDVLHAKGFRNAEIRNLVYRLYKMYCIPVGQDDATPEPLYEEMLPKVAEYVASHQELYSTFNTDELRHSS